MQTGAARFILALAGAFLQLLGLSFLVAALLPGLGASSFVATAGGGGLLLMLFGATLFHRAVRSRPEVRTDREGGRRLFGGRGPIAPLLLLPIALVAGTLAISQGGVLLPLLAPAHFAMALLPALAVVAVVAKHDGGGRASTILVGLTWGGLVATSLAFLAESGFGLLLSLALFAAYILDGTAAPAAAVDALRAALTAGDEAALMSSAMELLAWPPLIAAAYALLAFIGPTVEELTKLMGVMLAKPTTRRGALILGVACGAGFGVTEAVLIGGSVAGVPPGPAGGDSITAGALVWPAGMLVRGITTAMHATLTGVAALGWHELTVERRFRQGTSKIGLAVLGHGLWNGLTLTAVIGGLSSLGTDGEQAVDQITGMALVPTVATLALVVMAWVIILTLWVLARRVQDRPVSLQSD